MGGGALPSPAASARQPPSQALQLPEERVGHSSSTEPARASKPPKPRPKWRSPAEFTIACVGYAVGLGNFWRFPYLCFNNGGGAFLVPYTFVLLLIGIPIFLLELGMGQKFQLGGGEIWQRIHPALKGVGIASTVATFIVCCYYNVVVAWSLWYFFRSMAFPLPWDDQHGGSLEFWEVDTLRCRAHGNASCSWDETTQWPQHPGIAQPGAIVWPLAGCLALAWFLVWLCVVKGVHSAGKVAWFTALFPYLVLAIMLVRGLTLEGASIGLKWYLTPRFDKLGDPGVWVAAASQIFYSLGIGWGTLPAFASYNEHHHNFTRDAWLVPLINCSTSFLAGLVVFSILGSMSASSGIAIDDMSIEGSGLAFVVYPAAIAKLPASPFFALLFFLMLLCLGLDSQFSMVETVLTHIVDAGIGRRFKRAHRSLALCASMFVLSLLFVTRGGLYWVQLVDGFAANLTLFMVGAVECVAVAWIYGADRFAMDALEMTGVRLPKPLLWNYKLIVPLLLVALTIQAFVSTALGEYHLPTYGIFIGWCLALVSALPIPGLALWHHCQAENKLSCIGCVPTDAIARAAGLSSTRTVPPEVAAASIDIEFGRAQRSVRYDAPL